MFLNHYLFKSVSYLLHARGGSRAVDIRGQDHQEALPTLASSGVGSGYEHWLQDSSCVNLSKQTAPSLSASFA